MNNSIAEAVRYVSKSGKEYRAFASGGDIQLYRQLVPPGQIQLVGKSVILPPFAGDKAIFALNGAELDKWKNHEYFPDMWEIFLRFAAGTGRNGLVGLHFDVLPQDEAYVLDWAPVEWDLSCYGSVLPNTWLEYLHSRVPIVAYNENFELPEIVILNPISRDRIKLEERVVS
ncbi:hypothetical protein HYU50_00495 [Candidatus Woesearchaeota archaeon]|nr:hypothetical protein [Candidatus Woesearchaeota archaeon]